MKSASNILFDLLESLSTGSCSKLLQNEQNTLLNLFDCYISENCLLYSTSDADLIWRLVDFVRVNSSKIDQDDGNRAHELSKDITA